MRADLIDVDALAQEIRRVDGNHSLGAGALAEALMPFLAASLSSPQEPVAVNQFRNRFKDSTAGSAAKWSEWFNGEPTHISPSYEYEYRSLIVASPQEPVGRVDENHIREVLLATRAALEEPLPAAVASQEPVAWQYRFMISNEWGGWTDLRGPVERFRTLYEFNFQNGTAELRALFASPVVPVAARAEAEGWRPIETATAGRWLMWVADSGERGTGQSVFGTVYVWEDGTRSYKPDGHHGDWRVTHCMPLPAAPTCEGEGQ